MLLRDGECFLSRATLDEANQSELFSESAKHTNSGVCDTNRLRVSGRHRSHGCYSCYLTVEVVTGEAGWVRFVQAGFCLSVDHSGEDRKGTDPIGHDLQIILSICPQCICRRVAGKSHEASSSTAFLSVFSSLFLYNGHVFLFQ